MYLMAKFRPISHSIIQANPYTAAYGFCISVDHPGSFVLAFRPGLKSPPQKFVSAVW